MLALSLSSTGFTVGLAAAVGSVSVLVAASKGAGGEAGVTTFFVAALLLRMSHSKFTGKGVTVGADASALGTR